MEINDDVKVLLRIMMRIREKGMIMKEEKEEEEIGEIDMVRYR